MAEIAHVRNFEKRSDVPMPDLSNERVFPSKGKVKAIFDASMKWHLIEEYGIESFTELSAGMMIRKQNGLLSLVMNRGIFQVM